MEYIKITLFLLTQDFFLIVELDLSNFKLHMVLSSINCIQAHSIVYAAQHPKPRLTNGLINECSCQC